MSVVGAPQKPQKGAPQKRPCGSLLHRPEGHQRAEAPHIRHRQPEPALLHGVLVVPCPQGSPGARRASRVAGCGSRGRGSQKQGRGRQRCSRVLKRAPTQPSADTSRVLGCPTTHAGGAPTNPVSVMFAMQKEWGLEMTATHRNSSAPVCQRARICLHFVLASSGSPSCIVASFPHQTFFPMFRFTSKLSRSACVLGRKLLIDFTASMMNVRATISRSVKASCRSRARADTRETRAPRRVGATTGAVRAFGARSGRAVSGRCGLGGAQRRVALATALTPMFRCPPMVSDTKRPETVQQAVSLRERRAVAALEGLMILNRWGKSERQFLRRKSLFFPSQPKLTMSLHCLQGGKSSSAHCDGMSAGQASVAATNVPTVGMFLVFIRRGSLGKSEQNFWSEPCTDNAQTKTHRA